MFKKTAYIITQRLCERGIVDKNEFELYEYGFSIGLTVLLNLISTVIIGVIMGKVFESILFLVLYIPLRSYAGGYHASTPWRCYLISIVIITAILIFISCVHSSAIYMIFLLAGIVICLLFAPVEDKNKPLDKDEIRVFRKISYLILLIEVCMWIILSFIYQSVGITIPLVIFTEGIMLILGKIKNLTILAEK